MAQYGLPNADQGTTSWTEGAGDADANWFDELDEGFGSGRGTGSGPDDATTYWQTGNNPGGINITYRFSSVTDPEVSTGHIHRIRAQKNPDGARTLNITVALWENDPATGTIDNYTPTVTNAWGTHPNTLGGAEADNITNYGDLGQLVNASVSGGGSPSGCWLSAGELEVPNAPGGATVVKDIIGAGLIPFPR